MKLKKNIPLIDQHDEYGFWGGKFGGSFIPETLKKPVEDLTKEFQKLRISKKFVKQRDFYFKNYVGSPTPFIKLESLSWDRFDDELPLKKDEEIIIKVLPSINGSDLLQILKKYESSTYLSIFTHEASEIVALRELVLTTGDDVKISKDKISECIFGIGTSASRSRADKIDTITPWENPTTDTDKINDPIIPEIVLFGLIFVSFLPLNVLPNINPPISENIHIKKIMYIYNLFVSLFPVKIVHNFITIKVK